MREDDRQIKDRCYVDYKQQIVGKLQVDKVIDRWSSIDDKDRLSRDRLGRQIEGR